MRWVILEKDEITESIRSGNTEVPFGLQYIIRVTAENEDILRGYKKYTAEELRSVDRDNISQRMQSRLEHLSTNSPFASKCLPDGRKLYRRKHGVKQVIPGNSVESILFTVPYATALIDEVEITNCEASDEVDLSVLDSANGDYTTVPNYLLNQFGFRVNLSDIYYTDSSQYDATLLQGMQIEVKYYNNGSDPKEIGVNFVLHEAKEA